MAVQTGGVPYEDCFFPLDAADWYLGLSPLPSGVGTGQPPQAPNLIIKMWYIFYIFGHEAATLKGVMIGCGFHRLRKLRHLDLHFGILLNIEWP